MRGLKIRRETTMTSIPIWVVNAQPKNVKWVDILEEDIHSMDLVDLDSYILDRYEIQMDK